MVFSLFIGGTMTMERKVKVAQFEFGQDVIVQSITANTHGGTFKIEKSAAPIEGIIIEIPEGALDKEEKISLGYNDGHLELRAGKSSGVVFIFRTDPETSFLKPVKIVIPYQKNLDPLGVTGYAIDEKGHLHLVDTAGMDKTAGTVSFYTFKPLLLTWVYIME
jgi:hypothetical protein